MQPMCMKANERMFTLFNFNQILSCILNSHTMAASHVDWKNIAAATLCMAGFHPEIFMHTANITQIISVEATISGPRAQSKTALKYL